MTPEFKRAIKSLERLAKQHQRGLELFLNLTHACPLRCQYCYVDYDRPVSWTPAKLEYLLDRLVINKRLVKLITFFGGEPGLRIDLMRHALDYAYAKGIGTTHFGIITSLSVRARELLTYPVKYPGLELVISMDTEGPTARLTRQHKPFYPLVRSTNQTQPSYRELLPIADNVLINKVISGQESLKADFDWLQELYDVYGLMFSYNPVKNPVAVDQPAVTDGFLHHLRWCLSSSYVPKRTKTLLTQWVRHKAGYREPGCGINSEYFLDGSGLVSPCSVTHSHRALGPDALRVTDPTGALSEQIEFATSLEQAYFDNPVCQACELKGFCGGGCLAERYREHQRYDLPNHTHCQLTACIATAIKTFADELGESRFQTFTQTLTGSLIAMTTYCVDKAILNTSMREATKHPVLFRKDT